MERLGIYAAFGITEGRSSPFFVQQASSAVVTLLMALALLTAASLHASKHLHAPLLWNLLCQPMNFFDTTPIARILNRLSKDIESVDGQLPYSFRRFVPGIMLVGSRKFQLLLNQILDHFNNRRNSLFNADFRHNYHSTRGGLRIFLRLLNFYQNRFSAIIFQPHVS